MLMRDGAGSEYAVRKHRAPNGALRLQLALEALDNAGLSESTERQKVHLDSWRRLL